MIMCFQSINNPTHQLDTFTDIFIISIGCWRSVGIDLVGKWNKISMIMEEKSNFDENVSNEDCKDSWNEETAAAAGPIPTAAVAR